MQKPSRKTKQRNRLRSRRAYRHHIARNVSKKRTPKHFKHRKTELPCPESFSLDDNFDAVVSTLAVIRRESRVPKNKPSEQVFILLQNIAKISPSGALVLAAEIFRWTRLPSARRLKASMPGQWNPEVRKLLADMGFFKLLGLESYIRPNNGDNNIRYVQFRTGTKSEGADAIEFLKDDLEPIVGEIPGSQYMYAAITEAMTNVRQHAYPNDRIVTNWWLSASYDTEKGEVRILIYDQGVGIPSTLSGKLTQDIVETLSKNHAGLIEKAHDLARSASKEKHRGKGLGTDVRGYFDRLNCCGHYRVISLKGEYVYKKIVTDSTSKRNHESPLRGTLIEWSLKLQDE